MNKQQLAAKIWESANKLRSKIEANEYKDYILGFIFYKFLSDKEEQLLRKDDWGTEDLKELTEDDTDTVDYCRRKLGYFISYNNLFSTWLAMGRDFDVSNVTDALSAFNRLIDPKHKKVFEKIFDTLDTGLSKLGDTSGARTKAISNLLQLIKDIPMDGKEDYDVLGFIYEYLISNFAANAGKKAGEFYTPHEVSLLMSEIVANHLKDREKIEIYDPTSGSGSLLINIGQVAAKHMGSYDNIKYYAQELKENTYNLTRMNLVMRGILPDNIVTRNGDTLEEDWPFFDENHVYAPLYVDAVVSNPPYSLHWEPTEDKKHDPRYANYGMAPKSKADYAFLLHDLYHLKPDGIMTIVLPHGVLFRGGEEGDIRRNLIEKNNIDAIIGLPANIFFGTGIPTIIMVLRQKRENTDVLIVDASKHFEKAGKNNKLRASDIKRIVDAVTGRRDVPKFSRKVSRDEIRRNDYNLNIPRYVDSSEAAESWDILATMSGGIPNSEIDALEPYWKAFPNLRRELFRSDETPYSNMAVEDVAATIRNSADVLGFIAAYRDAFSGFEAYLYEKLIAKLRDMEVSANEAEISGNIFGRLETIPLVDQYEAYQILDNSWATISSDLETIRQDGFAATKCVDPNMVLKKKGDTEEEVQDGWVGRIIPFELAQTQFLASDLAALQALEDRLAEIPSAYEEALDALSEEDKEKDFVNEDKTAFVWPEVKKALKVKEEEPGVLAALKTAAALNEEEKALKKQIKTKSAELHVATKAVIEALSDEQVLELLELKWIAPLSSELHTLPEAVVAALSKKITALAQKYEVTLHDLDADIRRVEQELANMLGELTGGEHDVRGLVEFILLLGGEDGDRESMLKKMFSKGGSKAPKIRFAGFTNPWEQRKFSEAFDFLQNNTLSRAELNSDNGVAGNVHYGDVLVKFGECLNVSQTRLPYISAQQVVDKFKRSLLQDGDVIMADTAEDETAGKCTEVSELHGFPTISGLHTIPIRPKEKFATGYLGYYMNSGAYHDQLLPLMQGIKVISVSKSAVQNTAVSFPSDISEQSAIGRYFIQLDNLITLYQQKHEKLKQLKQSLLQKMFV